MKRNLLLGAGLVAMLGAGVALAQAPGEPPRGPDGGPPGDMRGGEMRGGEMGHYGRYMMRRPPPSKAARFMFRKGDAVVAIKCADDEPTKACVDAGSALLDKLAPQQR